MRNINEYPMTNDEAIDILEKLRDSLLQEGLIGDIRPYALGWVIEKLEKEIEQ